MFHFDDADRVCLTCSACRGHWHRHCLAHRCARPANLRGCRNLRENHRQGTFRARSRAAPPTSASSISTKRRATAPDACDFPPISMHSFRRNRRAATGRSCSTCSTAAARTCWRPSIGRRRGTIRPSDADFGDGFLMRQGFTLVWVGWQFDIPSRDGLMGLDAPAVMEDGHPIVGQVTTSFVPEHARSEPPARGPRPLCGHKPLSACRCRHSRTC